jgi:amidohydrolase
MGTPAEEGLGGKIQLLKEGAFKGIDIVLTAHPFYLTSTDPGWISVSGFRVKFFGKSAHASGSPEEGINALDAANMLFAGIGAWRQQLPEETRVHGVIHKGGIAPNIIPDFAECEFYLRADNHKMHMKMEKRFKDIVKGAALMTGTKYEMAESRSTYECSVLNKPLNDEFFAAAEEVGMKPEHGNGRNRVSSDFGNVSRVIPSANYMFDVTKQKIPLHSLGFQKAAAAGYAFEQTFNVAAAMSKVALKFYTDKNFRSTVEKDFREHK